MSMSPGWPTSWPEGQSRNDLLTSELVALDGTAAGVTLGFVFFPGLLLFVGAEIASFVVVAEQIGFLWALGILLVLSALGPFVVRSVGVGVLAHTQQRLARGEVPTRELLDGLVILMGGVMICVPGFIGDALGLMLMIGPLRRLVIRMVGHRLARPISTIRIRNRHVTDTRSRAEGDTSFPPSGLTDRSLGPGDDSGRR
jgi:UPF0716 protein FxsA